MDQSNIDLRSKYRSITLVRESYAADVRLAYDRRTIRVRPAGTRKALGRHATAARHAVAWPTVEKYCLESEVEQVDVYPARIQDLSQDFNGCLRRVR